MLEILDNDVAKIYEERGLGWVRPRYVPVVRALVEHGPMAIRDLAKAVSVTHSAASQTVAQMAKDELIVFTPGEDARQRIVHLTDKARELLPLLDAEWDATEAAAAELEAELSFPLGELLDEVLRAVERRPMVQRIRDAAVANGIEL